MIRSNNFRVELLLNHTMNQILNSENIYTKRASAVCYRVGNQTQVKHLCCIYTVFYGCLDVAHTSIFMEYTQKQNVFMFVFILKEMYLFTIHY